MLEPLIINPKELFFIAQIERDETWLYGEVVGHEVDAKCAEVVSRVIEVVLRCAAKWRSDLEPVIEEIISPVSITHCKFVTACRLEEIETKYDHT